MLLIYHNYDKILKSDWLSPVLISAVIGQCDRTERVMPKWLYFTANKKTLEIFCVLTLKSLKYHKFCHSYD